MRNLKIFLILIFILFSKSSFSLTKIKWEQIFIQTAESGSKGLETLLIWPDTPGKHPTVLMTHGTSRDKSLIKQQSAMYYYAQAQFFARRGFAVAFVMRHGFGRSGGGGDLYLTSDCNNPGFLTTTKASIKDLSQALNYLATLSQFDTTQTVLVGVSTGGMAITGFTAFPNDNKETKLIAAINFAGGHGSIGNGRICGGESRLIQLAADLGKTSRVPMLWIYAKNDQYFGPELAKNMFTAFNAAGGQAKFVTPEAFGEDGHSYFKGGMDLWENTVDNFLKEQKIATLSPLLEKEPVGKKDMPAQLAKRNEKAYQDYLLVAPHKAFAISKSGSFGKSAYQFSKEEAEELALSNRKKFSNGSPCEIYDSN